MTAVNILLKALSGSWIGCNAINHDEFSDYFVVKKAGYPQTHKHKFYPDAEEDAVDNNCKYIFMLAC